MEREKVAKMSGSFFTSENPTILNDTNVPFVGYAVCRLCSNPRSEAAVFSISFPFHF